MIIESKVREMKIKVLCNDSVRYEAIRSAVVDKDSTADVSGGVGSVDELPAFVNGSFPDVLIVDEANARSLAGIEALSLRKPGIDSVLISNETSADFLMNAMRAGVREVLPAPCTSDALQAALVRIMHKRGKQAAPQASEGKVLAFLSCKGGSGATFLAANLAYVLAAEQGKRVALIDLNLQFGDAAMFVSDQHAPNNVAEVAQQIHRLDASFLQSAMLEAAPNFFVLAAPEDPAHSTDVRREHIEAIVRLARRHYDVVVIDVARSLDTVSLQALDMADVIFPVLQLTLPFVRDGKRLLDVFRSLDYPRDKVHLIVNRYEKGGELSLADLEQAIGEKVFKTVPNSYAAAAASVNLGLPIAKAQKGNPISKALVEMARELVPAQEQSGAGAGWLSRVFARPVAA